MDRLRLLYVVAGSALCAGLFALPHGDGWGRIHEKRSPAAYLERTSIHSRAFGEDRRGTVNATVIGHDRHTVIPIVSLVSWSPASPVAFYTKRFSASEIGETGRIIPLPETDSYALVWFDEHGQVRVKPTTNPTEVANHNPVTMETGAKPVFLYASDSLSLGEGYGYVHAGVYGTDLSQVGDCLDVVLVRTPGRTTSQGLHRKTVAVSEVPPGGIQLPVFDSGLTVIAQIDVSGAPLLTIR